MGVAVVVVVAGGGGVGVPSVSDAAVVSASESSRSVDGVVASEPAVVGVVVLSVPLSVIEAAAAAAAASSARCPRRPRKNLIMVGSGGRTCAECSGYDSARETW